MKTKKMDVGRLTMLAMLCGLLVVMGMTGIGLIPLPVIKATTMHIPVILGAILLGPSAGAVLGAVFGLCSIWSNTTSPGLLSFAFSPFMTQEGAVGAVKALWIALGCRILLGVAAGWLWRLVKRMKLPDVVSLPVTATLATLLHTAMVMGSIYLLLAQQYAAAKNVGMEAVLGLVLGTVTASGIPEAIAAAILVTVLGKAIMHFMDGRKRR